ncbi:unnamed protein product [Urochloa humidicola]
MAGCCRRRLLRLLGLLALLLTAFTCTWARPLTNKNGIILLPVASAGASGGTPAPPSSSNTMMPTAEADRSHHHHLLPATAGNKRYEWLLNRKPRGKPPPSAPSKRTN